MYCKEVNLKCHFYLSAEKKEVSLLKNYVFQYYYNIGHIMTYFRHFILNTKKVFKKEHQNLLSKHSRNVPMI